jgi:hypothetical protein
LLWKSGAAHGPKTAANATRHDDTVILVVHDFPCALECWKSEARKNRAESGKLLPNSRGADNEN